MLLLRLQPEGLVQLLGRPGHADGAAKALNGARLVHVLGHLVALPRVALRGQGWQGSNAWDSDCCAKHPDMFGCVCAQIEPCIMQGSTDSAKAEECRIGGASCSIKHHNCSQQPKLAPTQHQLPAAVQGRWHRSTQVPSCHLMVIAATHRRIHYSHLRLLHLLLLSGHHGGRLGARVSGQGKRQRLGHALALQRGERNKWETTVLLKGVGVTFAMGMHMQMFAAKGKQVPRPSQASWQQPRTSALQTKTAACGPNSTRLIKAAVIQSTPQPWAHAHLGRGQHRGQHL